MKAAIIGAGLGGLSAAIHLRQAGYDVTVFEAQATSGGRANRISRDGFHFDTGPSLLNYPWVFEDLFKTAGRRMEDYVTLLPIDPSITFRWRDGESLTLSSQIDELIREIERLEPGSAPGVARFMRDASDKFRLTFDKLVTKNADSPIQWLGTLKWNELKKLSLLRSLEGDLSKYFHNPRIRQALGSYAMYLGGSPYSLPGIFSILPYGELAYGLWLPKGGIYAMVEAIQKLAEEIGVEFRFSTPVERIVRQNGSVSGIVPADGVQHNYPVVISNVDVPTTLTKLLDQGTQHAQARKKWSMTPGVITFYWGLRREIPNLPHHSIYLPDDYRKAFKQLQHGGVLPDELPFYISAPSKSDLSLAPAGKTLMFGLVPTPVLSQMGDVNWKHIVADARSQVLARLAHHDIHISEDDFLVEEVWTPVDWGRKFGLYDGSAFGLSHTLMNMGPLRPKNYASDIKGLYFVGASTTPGTGMPMVLLSGRMTAERIVGHVR
jgi:phytoene desaturase